MVSIAANEKGTAVTIVGHDPGSKNYGIAAIKFVRPEVENFKDPIKALSFSLVMVRKMQHCLTDLKDSTKSDKELRKYLEEVQEVERSVLPQAHIAERYMSRRMGGVTIELVNMTLGALRHHGYTYGSPIKLIPASQWKNELKRRGVLLPEVYKEAKAFKYSDHEVDAVFIALYGACVVSKVKPYNFEDVGKFVSAVVAKMGKLKEGGGKLPS